MAEPTPTPRTPRDFAEERSHRDAVVSNETIRATAQAVILINGGAATAILAYLAKNGLDPFVLHQMSWCLAVYGVGVVFGACMMFCAIRSLDFYNVRWPSSIATTRERARSIILMRPIQATPT
jgi:hypothetical protein